jgi:hypothetical protein
VKPVDVAGKKEEEKQGMERGGGGKEYTRGTRHASYIER